MKLHQSTTLNNIDRFSWTRYVNGRYWKTRDCIGYYTYWKVCEYFQPKSILEIGFFEGLTFGLMFESTDNDAKYVCIDKDFSNKWHFDDLFQEHPKYSSIEFLKIDSRDLKLTQNYDLVHIDGNHSYDYVKNDLEKVLPFLHKDSILIMDDLTNEHPDVTKIVDEYLLGQYDFVPFLSSSREMFFHHMSHKADDFLDNFLPQDSTNIMTFFNADYKEFTVLKGHVANFFNDNENIFIDQLRKYNL